MNLKKDHILMVDYENIPCYISQSDKIGLCGRRFRDFLNANKNISYSQRTIDVIKQMDYFINGGERELLDRSDLNYCPQTRYILYLPYFDQIILFFGVIEFMSVKNLIDFSKGLDKPDGLDNEVLAVLAQNDTIQERLGLREYFGEFKRI